MKEIKLDASTIKNEIQEKLKLLSKYQESAEFEAIKQYCEGETEKLLSEIQGELAKRKTKADKHEAIYSELDLMLLSKSFLEDIDSKSTDVTFKAEIAESLENIQSHLVLQSGGDFDYCVHSYLSYVKQQYKLYMGIEFTMKQMIQKYELQEKDLDINKATNAYATPSTSGQLETE